jgi:hypothetical protein
MPPDVQPLLRDIFTFVGIIVAMGCFTGMMTSWFKHRARRFGGTPDLTSRLDDIVERLSRLDTGVDAMAVEIERISEAQRFTAKLLAERTGPQPDSEKQRIQ